MPLPKMSPGERMARQREKQQRLLAFLASGEVWTDAANAARIWGLSPDATAATLRAMVRDRLLVREDIQTGPLLVYPIFGITPDGIAVCDTAPATASEHQVGRLQPLNIVHSLSVQRVRIFAEAAGWTAWQPGRLLYKTGLPVVPDAVGTAPDGKRVAIEMERNVKSLKRRREVISGHVLTIAKKTNWDRVLYVCDARCDAERVKELYMSLDELDTPSGRTPVTDAHRARFEFVNLSNFKG